MRGFIVQPGVDVLKLITVLSAPAAGLIAGFIGGMVAGLDGFTTGEVTGVAAVAVTVGLSGVIWWLSDLFMIKNAAWNAANGNDQTSNCYPSLPSSGSSVSGGSVTGDGDTGSGGL